MKFFPHGIGRDRQTVTYDTVKDHIVQYVQKTYNNGQDIAISLRDLVVKDLSPLVPRREQATSTDGADKANKQNGHGHPIPSRTRQVSRQEDYTGAEPTQGLCSDL